MLVRRAVHLAERLEARPLAGTQVAQVVEEQRQEGAPEDWSPEGTRRVATLEAWRADRPVAHRVEAAVDPPEAWRFLLPFL